MPPMAVCKKMVEFCFCFLYAGLIVLEGFFLYYTMTDVNIYIFQRVKGYTGKSVS